MDNQPGHTQQPESSQELPEQPSTKIDSKAHHDQQKKQSRRQLPDWLNHFTPFDLKILFRCWVAAWVAFLLMVIQPSLDHIGIAAFFGIILLIAIPPATTLVVYLLAAFSLLFGMCLAWAWGLLTMKAALAARPEAETQARLAELQQQAGQAASQSGQPPEWEAQILVHNGFMLDTRVTVVFYVMSCVFIYAISRLRCANPKLVLMQIFSIIVADLAILIGPTLPSFTGDLWVVLVKPGAIGIGIGAVCCLLFFPQSTSYVVLGQLAKLTRVCGGVLDTTSKRLHDEEASVVTLKSTRAGMVAMFKAIQPNLAFLPLDFSRGHWGPEDVQGLQSRVRKLMLASLYLIDFHIARINAAEMLEEAQEKSQSQSEEDETPRAPHTAQEDYQLGQRHRREATNLLRALRRPEQNEIRDKTVKTLQESTAGVLDVGSDAVDLAVRYIHAVNSKRWGGLPKAEYEDLTRQMRVALDKLGIARKQCVTMTNQGILEAHGELFDDSGHLKPEHGGERPFLPSMIIAMVFEERILAMSVAIEELLEYIIQLSATRKTRRFWVPSRVRAAVSWLLNSRVKVPVAGAPEAEDDPDDETDDTAGFDEKTRETRRRLEISRVYRGPSARRRNKFSKALVATYNWLTNAAGMYALRMVLVTVATSIPASVAHSAGFFYREKGIWMVISAQTVLLFYMADFTFSLITRAVGTIVGGVMGMVTWYIGAGSGPGNHYGMAAIGAVMIIPILWCRLFLPAAFTIATIMTGATWALVVGFSWDEAHTTQYGLPGVGYQAFWKRVVTVLLGFVAAAVVQLFPKPPSATTHVRKTLANSVRSLSDHYALLISHWGRAENDEALGSVAARASLEVTEVLMALDPSIQLLKMEGSFGPFDHNVLRQTQEQCQYINQALGGLLNQASKLPKDLQERLTQSAGILDDRAIEDIFAVLAIIEQALRTGSPLPERLPAPLVRRAVESYMKLGENSMMTTALVQDEQHRWYCVAVTLYLKLLTSIDDLLLVLKSALGERHIVYQWEDV